MHRNPTRAAGLTLLESLVTLVILAITLALALPALHELLQRHRTTAAINELVTAMHLARSIAVTHRTVALMCPSHDGHRCTGGTDWSQGWIVFNTPDRQGQPSARSRIVLRVARGDTPALRIHASAGRRALRYHALGFSGGSNLTLRLCEENTLRARVVVNNTGRPRSETPDSKVPCHGRGKFTDGVAPRKNPGYNALPRPNSSAG